MKLRFLPFVLIFSISCASVGNTFSAKQYMENGDLSKDEKTRLGLVISAEEDYDMGSKYFYLFRKLPVLKHSKSPAPPQIMATYWYLWEAKK